jgi:hypothetical protein
LQLTASVHIVGQQLLTTSRAGKLLKPPPPQEIPSATSQSKLNGSTRQLSMNVRMSMGPQVNTQQASSSSILCENISKNIYFLHLQLVRTNLGPNS